MKAVIYCARSKIVPPLLPAKKLYRAIALIVASLSVGSVFADDVGASPEVDQSSGDKHCLWRVTNAKAPVYLLGAIHCLRKTDYPLPAVIERAIEASQQFYFEYDPTKRYQFDQKMNRLAFLPPGVQVKKKVRPETWEYLKKIAQGGSYNWTQLKAWAIAHYVLYYTPYERIDASYGLDSYVERKAQKRHCPTFGLESVDDHVAVYSGMSDIESEAYLLEAIVYADQSDARFREMVAAWRVGDTKRLFALEMPDLEDAPGLNPRFLDDRNARWIPVIEGVIKSEKPTLIVVGAMHFSGPHSVLGMLRARGYHLEQL
jgi:uncharacterized protein YbaP (TraB family)